MARGHLRIMARGSREKKNHTGTRKDGGQEGIVARGLSRNYDARPKKELWHRGQ